MEILNEKQDNEARYEKHHEWRKENRHLQRTQCQDQRNYDKKSNPIPGRKQGGMEAAREAIRLAKERGDLIEPKDGKCTRCKKPTKKFIFHHTKGYAKKYWLVGKFVCSKCHAYLDNNKKGDHTHLGEPVRKDSKLEKAHPDKKKKYIIKKIVIKDSAIEESISSIAEMITDDPDVFI